MATSPETTGPGALLEMRGLKTHFFTRKGVVKAVDGVSLSVDRGKVLGVFGESGGGKSVTAWSILGLVTPPGRIVGGQILFKGRDLVGLSRRELQAMRGGEIAMVFQDPMTSLTPFFTVGNQLIETIRQHRQVTTESARATAIRMLKVANLPDPEAQMRVYPFQLSGGMRQRVMIAMALSCAPDLLLADEPTTALDVTTQAQILLEMRELQRQFGTSIVIITHDLGVINELADDAVVMYAGRVVESAAVEVLMRRPQHPYTRALIASVPTLNSERGHLEPIPGLPPDLLHLPTGCAFMPRCRYAQPLCSERLPVLETVAAGHQVACHLVGQLAGRVA